MTSSSLIQVVHWLEDVFDRLGLERSYGGAIAYNYHGPPRLTLDVDVLVLLPALRTPAFLEQLRLGGCLHGDSIPVPIDVTSALPELREGPHLATFRCRGVRVEIFTPWHPFHRRVLDRSPVRDLSGRPIRIHSAEDLIVFKKIFDRPKDLMDIRAMLLAREGLLDLDLIRREAADLLGETSMIELEEMLAAD